MKPVYASAELEKAHTDMYRAMRALMRADYSTDPGWKKNNVALARKFDAACKRFGEAQRRIKR